MAHVVASWESGHRLLYIPNIVTALAWCRTRPGHQKSSSLGFSGSRLNSVRIVHGDTVELTWMRWPHAMTTPSHLLAFHLISLMQVKRFRLSVLHDYITYTSVNIYTHLYVVFSKNNFYSWCSIVVITLADRYLTAWSDALLLRPWSHVPVTDTERASASILKVQLLYSIDSLRPSQNGRHFTDDILEYISLYENWCILIQISLKFVPNGPIDNNNSPALVQIMA